MTSLKRTDPCPSPLEPDDQSDVRGVHLGGELDVPTAPSRWEGVRRQLADAPRGVAPELSGPDLLGVGGPIGLVGRDTR